MGATRRSSTKTWTFLVYMAGDNNLEGAGVEDLREMKEVGSTEAVNVVAQFDRPSGSTRYVLRRGTPLAKDAVATLGAQNTGEPTGLLDFIRWGVATFPGERVALVLWNHGQGWDDTDIFADERGRRDGLRDLRRPPHIRRALFRSTIREIARLTAGPSLVARAILVDDGAKDFLDNLELKKVLTATRRLLGRKLDLLGMDACLMSMPEVGYQARTTVAYTVGSEEVEPGDGWPYAELLAGLAKEPALDGEGLGRLVVKEYLRSYRRGRDAVTQSVCDLGAAAPLAAAVKRLATALREALASAAARHALLDVRNQVQEFEVRDNVDLGDLCQLLRQSTDLPDEVKAAAVAVEAAALGVAGAGAYVLEAGYVGEAMRHTTGASIYFPTVLVSPLYRRLDWARATGWGAFVQDYIDATRSRQDDRRPRRGAAAAAPAHVAGP